MEAFPIVIIIIILMSILQQMQSLNTRKQCLSKINKHVGNKFYANPVTRDGNALSTNAGEDEIFQWFDEALIYVRAGSGISLSRPCLNCFIAN
jgi:hypothetical protein